MWGTGKPRAQEREVGRKWNLRGYTSPCLAVGVQHVCICWRLEDPTLPVTCGLDPHLSMGIMCQFWHSTDAVDLGS